MANTKKTNKKKISKKRVDQKNKRNLFIAILMILCTGIVLTVTTYAWFTANRNVTVDGIDVNVAAVQGLQLSVDAQNWKAAVDRYDIIGAEWDENAGLRVTNHVPENMVPVSTVGTITDGKMEMFKGTILTDSGNYILTADRVNESKDTTEFVAFDLFFQYFGEDTTPVALSLTDSSVSSLGNRGIQNAARVAFIKLGHAATGTAAKDLQALNTVTEKKIWEPNSDTHTLSGQKNALDVYGKNVTETSPDRLSYLGVKLLFSSDYKMPLSPTTEEQLSYFEEVKTIEDGGILFATKANNVNPGEIFTLEPGVTKIRFYMWVEGQDVDCENNASGDQLTYSLKFSIPE